MAGIAIFLGVVALVQSAFLILSGRDNDHLRHLCNAYRAELGEPPLYPSLHCDICNPFTPSNGRPT